MSIDDRLLSIAKANNRKVFFNGKFYLPDGSIQETVKETIGSEDNSDTVIFDKEKHRAKTSSKIAFWLLGLLSCSVFIFVKIMSNKIYKIISF